MVKPAALILDYGEVLSRPQRPGSHALLATLLGVPEAELTAAYWRHRRDYDLGLPVDEYWARVAADFGQALDAERRKMLVEVDVDSWTDYREETWTLAERFRAAGGKVAMLSNGVPQILQRIRSDRDLPALFDVVVISYEVELAKPDPRIFELTLDRLGAAPDAALFVDDRAENIDGAAALGIQTLHFTGDHSVPALASRLS